MVYELAKTETSSGLKAVEVCDSIWLIENVMDEADRLFILDYIENASEELWSSGFSNTLRKQAVEVLGSDITEEQINEYVRERAENPDLNYWVSKSLELPPDGEFEKIAQRLDDKVREFFDGVFKYGRWTLVSRHVPGVDMTAHKDQGEDLTLARASMLYLNDDYEGGEIYFVNFDFEIKAPAGSVLVFPSTEHWTHGVRTVRPGRPRYAMPALVWTIEKDIKLGTADEDEQ